MTRRVTAIALSSLVVLAVTACGDDDDSSTSISADQVGDVVAGEPFPADRCEANKAAGTITYLTGFDYAATASIVDVLVAKEKGYFDDMCLDVEIKAGFSVDNYPFIAANDAQFSSAGSFSEVVNYATTNEASFVALAVEGKTGIDALIVKEGQATTLEDLRGSTIGVKGAITTSVAAMLKQAGLTEGADYTTVLIDGFDPKVHIEIPDIVGFPGYKSNEPLQLEAAGIPFTLFDPADYDIPGSFGVLYTNGQFLGRHPDGRAGLHPRLDDGSGRRGRRPDGGVGHRRRLHQRQRQRDVPVARGRARPLGRRVGAGHLDQHGNRARRARAGTADRRGHDVRRHRPVRWRGPRHRPVRRHRP